MRVSSFREHTVFEKEGLSRKLIADDEHIFVYDFCTLYIVPSTLSIVKKLVLGKKNIGSLYIDGETLYAASHDGKLFKIDMKSFEIETLMKKVHKKMFFCAGIYEDMLIHKRR